jgi:hypothetical protein
MKKGARGLGASLHNKKKTLVVNGSVASGGDVDRRIFDPAVAGDRTTFGDAAQPQLHSCPGDRPRYLGVVVR